MTFFSRSSTKFERVKLYVARARKSDKAKLPKPKVISIRERSPMGLSIRGRVRCARRAFGDFPLTGSEMTDFSTTKNQA